MKLVDLTEFVQISAIRQVTAKSPFVNFPFEVVVIFFSQFFSSFFLIMIIGVEGEEGGGVGA